MKNLIHSQILKVSFVAALMLLGFQVQAQLHVASDGEVGIGTTTPIGQLDVRTGTDSYRSLYLYNTYNSTTSKYGIYNYLTSDGTGNRYGQYNLVYDNPSTTIHYGIYNYNNVESSSTAYGIYNSTYCATGNGARYGLYNYLSCSTACGTGAKYALYSGLSSVCGTGYAGYFNGDVYVVGTITSTSDAAKKTNINSLNGALSIISQLKPKTYNYKEDQDLNLPDEKQYGFLAQEVEQVLPDLVKTVETLGIRPQSDNENPEQAVPTGEIKTINYQGLIPILVQGMQEQQQLIDAQQKRIAELEAKINR